VKTTPRKKRSSISPSKPQRSIKAKRSKGRTMKARRINQMIMPKPTPRYRHQLMLRARRAMLEDRRIRTIKEEKADRNNRILSY
jgi:hypothetical protein